MTSKTAIAQAIEKIEHAVAYNVEGSHKVEPYTWTQLSNDLHDLLTTEKEQIIDAFEPRTDYGKRYESGEEYYNQTYGQ